MTLADAIKTFEAFAKTYGKLSCEIRWRVLGLSSNAQTAGKLSFLNGPHTHPWGAITPSADATNIIFPFIEAARYIVEKAEEANFKALGFNDPTEIRKYRACASFALGEIMSHYSRGGYYWVQDFLIDPQAYGAAYYYRLAAMYAQAIGIRHEIPSHIPEIDHFPKNQKRLIDHYHYCFVRAQSIDGGRTYLTLAQRLANLILQKGADVLTLLYNDTLLVMLRSQTDEKAAAHAPFILDDTERKKLIADVAYELFHRTADYAGDLVHAISELNKIKDTNGASEIILLLKNIDTTLLSDAAKKSILVNTLLHPTEFCDPLQLNAAIDRHFPEWKAELNALVVATAKMRASKVAELYRNGTSDKHIAKWNALQAIIKALPAVPDLPKAPTVNASAAATGLVNTAVTAVDHKSAAAPASLPAATAAAAASHADIKELNFGATFTELSKAEKTKDAMTGSGVLSTSWLKIKNDNGQLIFPVAKITGSVTKDTLIGLRLALLRLNHKPPVAAIAILPAVVTSGSSGKPPSVKHPKPPAGIASAAAGTNMEMEMGAITSTKPAQPT